MATTSPNRTTDRTANGSIVAKTAEAPAKPKKMKTPADTRRISVSGIRLPRTMPMPMPILSATTIPAVVPRRTAIGSVYLTAKLMVASWVLSPSSARKNAMATVRNGPKLERCWSSPSSVSPRMVQSPKRMKDRAAVSEMTSSGMTLVSRRPAATARAWFRRVATNTADSTVRAGNRVAKAIAKSWVLSPISARVTNKRDAINAGMSDCSSACDGVWNDQRVAVSVAVDRSGMAGQGFPVRPSARAPSRALNTPADTLPRGEIVG